MIQTRPARLLDAAALWAAEVETARTPGLLNSQPDELEEAAFAARIAALAPEGAYVVAEEEGRALLEHLLAWAEGRPDVEKVELAVRAGNEPPQRLYRRLGFQEEGRLRRRLRLPDGSFEDDLVMALFPREQR